VTTTATTPWAPAHRSLTVGVVMMVTVVAFQAMGVGTALPAVARDLGGLSAYGWAFSGFLLASIVGMVAAGQIADASGPVRPFTLAVLAFAGGSVLASAASSWGMLIAGRALQGLGDGASIALVYVSVARAYPAVLYGRVMALLSTAWVLPSLLGPGLAGLVAEHMGWRWVFLMLLPLLPVAFALALPGLRGLERPAAATPRASRLPAAVALAVGAGGLLAALQLGWRVGLIVGAASLGLGVPAFLRLLPRGTLRLRRGLPSSIAARGMVAVGFIGADAFLPLALTRLHGLSIAQAGLLLSAGSLSWSAGGILQGRLDGRDGGTGRPRRVRLGGAILTAGLLITAYGLVATDAGWPLALAGFVVAGLGIGIGYPSVGALALAQAPGGAEGSVSSALQLSETIGVAIFTGAAGAIVALGIHRGWPGETAITVIFGAAAAIAAATVLAGRRVVATTRSR
jgi:MFS family permease